MDVGSVESIFRKQSEDREPDEIRAAFDWLADGMLDELVRFAYKFTYRSKSRDGLELAKDAVQEAFLSAFRYRSSYDPRRGSFQNWLCTIVARESGAIVRKESGADIVSLDEERQIPAQSFQPELQIDGNKVKDYISQLSSTYREAIELCIMREMSHAEAAAIADCSKGAMKTRCFRALQELRCLMEKGGIVL